MIRTNIIANIAGKACAALFVVIFVPLYVRYLGPEAYGLIGVYAAVQTIAFMADVGLSGAFTRECARLSVSQGSQDELRSLGLTFEAAFWIIGLVTVAAVAALSSLVAVHWLRPTTLSAGSVKSALVMMGLATGLQFPFFVYQGGLLGLQRQVGLNLLLVSAGLARGLGALLLLRTVSPTVEVFFLWQVVIAAGQTMVGRLLMWRAFPRTGRPGTRDARLLARVWRFAAGMAGISLTSIALTQADKVILSRVLPLEQFGYYSLAAVMAGIPYLLAWPVNNAVYPRFTQLAALGRDADLAALYHKASQAMAVLVLPIGMMLALFPIEVMRLWTGDPHTVENTFRLVRLLAAGSTVLAMMYIPFALQLAYGWTRLTLLVNTAGLAGLIPAMMVLAGRYGATGVCYALIVLNLGSAAAIVLLMHRRLLPSERRQWCLRDVLVPALAAGAVAVVGRVLIPPVIPAFHTALALGGCWLAATAAAVAAAPSFRTAVNPMLRLWPGGSGLS